MNTNGLARQRRRTEPIWQKQKQSLPAFRLLTGVVTAQTRRGTGEREGTPHCLGDIKINSREVERRPERHWGWLPSTMEESGPPPQRQCCYRCSWRLNPGDIARRNNIEIDWFNVRRTACKRRATRVRPVIKRDKAIVGLMAAKWHAVGHYQYSDNHRKR